LAESDSKLEEQTTPFVPPFARLLPPAERNDASRSSGNTNLPT